MSRFVWPRLADIAKELNAINRMVDNECDVRLQVYEDQQWAIRWGASDYDLDHRGYWGASSVPGKGSAFQDFAIARDLLEQAREQWAMEKSAREGIERQPGAKVPL
jgi:hypothetical protein